MISNTNAQLIQNSITSYHKNQGRTRKKNEKLRGKKEQWSITWLKDKGAKTLRSVASWMNQWNCSQVNSSENNFLKKSSILALKCGTGLKNWSVYSSSKADWSCITIVAVRVEKNTTHDHRTQQNVSCVSRFRGRGRNVVKQQWSKQMGKRFSLFCIEHLEPLELRGTSTAGRTMLFCVV